MLRAPRGAGWLHLPPLAPGARRALPSARPCPSSLSPPSLAPGSKFPYPIISFPQVPAAGAANAAPARAPAGRSRSFLVSLLHQIQRAAMPGNADLPRQLQRVCARSRAADPRGLWRCQPQAWVVNPGGTSRSPAPRGNGILAHGGMPTAGAPAWGWGGDTLGVIPGCCSVLIWDGGAELAPYQGITRPGAGGSCSPERKKRRRKGGLFWSICLAFHFLLFFIELPSSRSLQQQLPFSFARSRRRLRRLTGKWKTEWLGGGGGTRGQTAVRLSVRPSCGGGLGASHASCPGIGGDKATPGGEKSSTGQFGSSGWAWGWQRIVTAQILPRSGADKALVGGSWEVLHPTLLL